MWPGQARPGSDEKDMVNERKLTKRLLTLLFHSLPTHAFPVSPDFRSLRKFRRLASKQQTDGEKIENEKNDKLSENLD